MKLIAKLILPISIVYIAFSLSMVATNNLDLSKPVDRYVVAPCYPGGNLNFRQEDKPLAKQIGDACQIDNSTRVGTSISWVEWRYLSDNRGNDEDIYIPIDTLFLLTLSGAVSISMLWKAKV